MAKATQFLKITDKNEEIVPGESFDEDHHGEIDLTGWSWGVEDPRVQPAAPKGGAAKSADPKSKDTKLKGEGESDSRPRPNILSFQKSTDSATARLLTAMNGGEIFPEAVLTIEERFAPESATSGGGSQDSPTRFSMKVELKDAFLVNFQWRANAESSGMTFSEDWQLNYSRIHIKYDWRPAKQQGRPAEGGVIEQFFDRPPDDSDNTVKKSPITTGEKRDMNDAQFEDYLKRNPQAVADAAKRSQRGR
jgi:type VI protein secretion system component Hcp